MEKQLKIGYCIIQKNKTSYTKIAKKMIKYLNIKNEDSYYISRGTYQASSRNFQVCKEK